MGSSRSTMSLAQVFEPQLSLEQLRQFWSDRYRICQMLELPVLHAARTQTIQEIISSVQNDKTVLVKQKLQYINQLEEFVREVSQEAEPYLRGAGACLDLYSGPAIQLPWIAKAAGNVIGVELVKEVSIYARSCGFEVVNAPASEALAAQNDDSVPRITAIRGCLHDPEWDTTMVECKRVLKPGGLFIVAEMFLDDKPPDRETNPGTKYRNLAEYELHTGLNTLYVSGPINNEGDPVRVAVFRKNQ